MQLGYHSTKAHIFIYNLICIISRSLMMPLTTNPNHLYYRMLLLGLIAQWSKREFIINSALAHGCPCTGYKRCIIKLLPSFYWPTYSYIWQTKYGAFQGLYKYLKQPGKISNSLILVEEDYNQNRYFRFLVDAWHTNILSCSPRRACCSSVLRPYYKGDSYSLY